MKNHELKSIPRLFQPIIEGRKSFEYRRHDRDFSVGDGLFLREFLPLEGKDGAYSGRVMRVLVQQIYLGIDIPGMPDDFCIMEIRLLSVWEED